MGREEPHVHAAGVAVSGDDVEDDYDEEDGYLW